MRIGTLAILSLVLAPATVRCQIQLDDVAGVHAVVGIGDVDNDGTADRVLARDGFAEVVSGATNQLLYRFSQLSTSSRTWPRVASADFDRDGHADIVLGFPFDRKPASGTSDGVVRIYSGKTGMLLREQWSLWPADNFGWSLDVIGDVDADSVPDYVVGAPSAPGGDGSYGVVTVHSGATGRMLNFDTGTSTVHKLGWSVTGLGDVDRDGVPDYAAATQQRGLVRVYSGKSHAILNESTYNGQSALDGLGDVDGDGYNDWAVASPSNAYVISGKTFAILHSFKQSYPNDAFGWDVAGPGDLDGDGRGDVIFSATGTQSIPGYASAYSGRTGAVLFTVRGPQANVKWGEILGAAGDYNGDGVPDFSFGSSKVSRALVFSGDARPLRVDVGRLSLSAGGTQNLYLEAGPAQKTKLYLVLGSLSGTSPGLRIGNVTLPLVVDPYFMFTATAPNTLIQSSVAILGSRGEGRAQFVLPPNSPPSLIGRRVHHAYLAMNLIPFGIDFASNAVFVDLLK